DRHHAVLRAKSHQRVAAENAVASPAVAALDALEQEALPAPVQLEESRHRRIEIGRDLPIDGDRVRLRRQTAEAFEVRDKRHPACLAEGGCGGKSAGGPDAARHEWPGRGRPRIARKPPDFRGTVDCGVGTLW